MTRAEIREILLRHHGEIARLARELEVSRTMVSGWLAGRMVSVRVDKAVSRRAKELLRIERKQSRPGDIK